VRSRCRATRDGDRGLLALAPLPAASMRDGADAVRGQYIRSIEPE
jgi:hypothetical protein